MKKTVFYFFLLLLANNTYSLVFVSRCQHFFSKKSTNLEAKTQDAKAEVGRPVFTKGMDEANRMISLAQKLRNSQVDPQRTHIPEFAEEIPKHIEFIREGIQKPVFKKKRGKLRILSYLEKEALDKKENKQVTYEWWLYWNQRLTHILDFKMNTMSLREDEFGINFFPKYILIPTIKELGVTAINRSFSEGVFPLGVTNKKIRGRINLYPAEFFQHDVGHFFDFLKFKDSNSLNNSFISEYGNDIKDLDKAFIDEYGNNIIEEIPYHEFQKLNLSMRQKEMIDTIYFIFSHEQMGIITDSFRVWINWFRLDLSGIFHTGDLRELLPNSVNANSRTEVRVYLKESAQFFEKIVRQIVEPSAVQ